MECKYCKIKMKPTCLTACDGWQCPKCSHKEVDELSFNLWGAPDDIEECSCDNCKNAS